MIDKLIEIDSKTDFAHIMNYANCETIINRIGSELIYFKVFINGKYYKLVTGDKIKIDSNYNIIIL